VEGISQGQPGHDSRQGVPGHGIGGALSFNQLHAECKTRIQQKRWCPQCEREVPNTELVKGYEHEKGHYVW
jgi:DNA end-binding protein Ku